MRTSQYTFVLVFLVWLAIGAGVRAQIAIVANDSLSVSDVSMSDLKRLYLGSLSTLGGQQITLLEFTPAAEAFYKTAINMTILKFRQHWLKIVFSGRAMTPPAALSDTAEINLIISKKPGAVGFLPLDKVAKGMKIISVNHKLPTDTGYSLQSTPKKD